MSGRGKRTMAVALFGALLSGFLPNKAPEHLPTIAQGTTEHVHEEPLPITTLEHHLFLQEQDGTIRPMRTLEELPELDKHTAVLRERLRHDDNEIVFYRASDHAIIDTYALDRDDPRWRAIKADPGPRRTHIDQRRDLMIRLAGTAERQVSREHGIPTSEIKYRVGSKDRFTEGIAASRPTALIERLIFESYGLPWQLTMLQHHESDSRTHLISKAWCAGTYQINRFNTLQAGHHAPPDPRIRVSRRDRRYHAEVRKAMNGLLAQYDERRNRIIAAHVAAQLLRRYAYDAGSVLAGTKEYIAGPGYVDPVRTGAYEQVGLDEPFAWVSFAIDGGWKEARRKYPTRYGSESADYLKELFSMIQEMPEEYLHIAPEETVDTDVVRIRYTGKLRVTGKQVAALMDREEYEFLNSHIPAGATIPDGGYVFLPRGAAPSFFERYADRIAEQPYLIIEDARLRMTDGSTPFFLNDAIYGEADLRYSQLAQRRTMGLYLRSDKAELERILEDAAYACEHHPTRFCKYNLDSMRQDLARHSSVPRQRLIRVVEQLPKPEAAR